MVIADHLNLTGRTPLLGPNADAIGPPLPGPDRGLEPAPPGRASTRRARPRASSWRRASTPGLLGPQYETPAEVRMLRTLGADAVGMSTVLECIAARWAGPRGLRRVAGHERRGRLQRRAADPRGGPRRRRRGRPTPRPRDPAVRGGPRPRLELLRPSYLTGSSRPAARAAFDFSAQAARTLSLCGRIGQCSSRLPISSQ